MTSKDDKLVINIYGAPGSGKTTLANKLIERFEQDNFKPALIREYATELIKNNQKELLDNQILVSKAQADNIDKALDKSNLCISESPIELGRLYNKNSSIDYELDEIIKQSNEKYTSINLFIAHDKISISSYDNTYRIHTADESVELEKELHKKCNLPLTQTIDVRRDDRLEYIYDQILNRQEFIKFYCNEKANEFKNIELFKEAQTRNGIKIYPFTEVNELFEDTKEKTQMRKFIHCCVMDDVKNNIYCELENKEIIKNNDISFVNLHKELQNNSFLQEAILMQHMKYELGIMDLRKEYIEAGCKSEENFYGKDLNEILDNLICSDSYKHYIQRFNKNYEPLKKELEKINSNQSIQDQIGIWAKQYYGNNINLPKSDEIKDVSDLKKFAMFNRTSITSYELLNNLEKITDFYTQISNVVKDNKELKFNLEQNGFAHTKQEWENIANLSRQAYKEVSDICYKRNSKLYEVSYENKTKTRDFGVDYKSNLSFIINAKNELEAYSKANDKFQEFKTNELKVIEKEIDCGSEYCRLDKFKAFLKDLSHIEIKTKVGSQSFYLDDSNKLKNANEKEQYPLNGKEMYIPDTLEKKYKIYDTFCRKIGFVTSRDNPKFWINSWEEQKRITGYSDIDKDLKNIKNNQIITKEITPANIEQIKRRGIRNIEQIKGRGIRNIDTKEVKNVADRW